MSQRIVTECDEHAERDERRDGESYDVCVRLAGTRGFVMLSVDLCDEDAKPLRDLVERFEVIGRLYDGPPPSKAPTASKQPQTCSICGATRSDMSGLRKHMRAAHGEGESEHLAEYACSECGKTFATPQGRGAHRNRAHGIKAGG